MKRTLLFITSVFLTFSCSDASRRTAAPDQPSNTVAQVQNNSESLTVSSHSQRQESTAPDENAGQVPQSGTKSKWTQSGDPIETGAFDLKIAAAEKNLNAKPGDETAKKELAAAYLERAKALTEARQYASALGDYRRVMKFDPGNPEAKDWIGQIIGIYESMNKSYPPEGEEPPPLEFKKGA